MDWFSIEVPGVGRIDRIAAEFQIWTGNKLPFASFRIKVIERHGIGFLGVPNVNVKNSITGMPEWTSGLGETIDGALQDTLISFFLEIKTHYPEAGGTEDNFVWADPDDF